MMTSVCLCYNRFESVIVFQSSIEEGLADPGFEILEGCICRWVPVLLSKLFTESCCFGGQTSDEGLQVVYQS